MHRSTLAFIIAIAVVLLFAFAAIEARAAETVQGGGLLDLLVPLASGAVDQALFYLAGLAVAFISWLARRFVNVSIDRTRQQQWHDAVFRAALLARRHGEAAAITYLRRTMPGTIAAGKIDDATIRDALDIHLEDIRRRAPAAIRSAVNAANG